MPNKKTKYFCKQCENEVEFRESEGFWCRHCGMHMKDEQVTTIDQREVAYRKSLQGKPFKVRHWTTYVISIIIVMFGLITVGAYILFGALNNPPPTVWPWWVQDIGWILVGLVVLLVWGGVAIMAAMGITEVMQD